jgi:hypothetical protein
MNLECMYYHLVYDITYPDCISIKPSMIVVFISTMRMIYVWYQSHLQACKHYWIYVKHMVVSMITCTCRLIQYQCLGVLTPILLFISNNTKWQYVGEAKYLGVFIYKDVTDCDVKDKWRNINMLIEQIHYLLFVILFHTQTKELNFIDIFVLDFYGCLQLILILYVSDLLRYIYYVQLWTTCLK